MDRVTFRPHLSIAYANTDQPVGSLRLTLEQLRKRSPVAVDVQSVVLVELRRDCRQYRYKTCRARSAARSCIDTRDSTELEEQAARVGDPGIQLVATSGVC